VYFFFVVIVIVFETWRINSSSSSSSASPTCGWNTGNGKCFVDKKSNKIRNERLQKCYLGVGIKTHPRAKVSQPSHTLWVIKKDQRNFSLITLPKVGRFYSFFHHWIQQGICNKILVTSSVCSGRMMQLSSLPRSLNQVRSSSLKLYLTGWSFQNVSSVFSKTLTLDAVTTSSGNEFQGFTHGYKIYLITMVSRL